MLWIGLYFVEILMFCTPMWKARKYIAPLLSITTVLLVIAAFFFIDNQYLLVLLPLSIFRVFNLVRVSVARMHANYLLKVTRRTALWLVFYHLAGIWLVSPPLLISVNELIIGLLAILTLLSLLIFGITINNIIKLSFKMPADFLADRDLPTVTVAIPARNETRELEECLRSIVASDYPKLEILVLDDCSQARTAEIIKSFAQDGVRFIKGDEPAERWLAKNQAYQKLYEQSSGKLILFCGVDVRLGPGAIRAQVNLLYSRNKKMLSVLPLRVAGQPNTTLFQPMRYWWELAIPRRLFNRPAVLSTCWLIEKAALKKLGGFGSVSHSVVPEGYFARELVKTDEYSFVRSSDELEVRTVKNMEEQRATSLRVRYPLLRRRPETVLAITIAELILFVAPLATITYMLIAGQTQYLGLPVISFVAVLATHLLILQVTNPANLVVSILTFPMAVAAEFFVNYVSMFKYEFGSVVWKDRNICIPVMHVIPRLPKA